MDPIRLQFLKRGDFQGCDCPCWRAPLQVSWEQLKHDLAGVLKAMGKKSTPIRLWVLTLPAQVWPYVGGISEPSSAHPLADARCSSDPSVAATVSVVLEQVSVKLFDGLMACTSTMAEPAPSDWTLLSAPRVCCWPDRFCLMSSVSIACRWAPRRRWTQHIACRRASGRCCGTGRVSTVQQRSCTCRSAFSVRTSTCGRWSRSLPKADSGTICSRHQRKTWLLVF